MLDLTVELIQCLNLYITGTFGRVYQGTLAPCPGSETESQSQTCEKEVLIKTIAGKIPTFTLFLLK